MTQSLRKVIQRLISPLLGKGYGRLPVLRSGLSWYKRRLKPEYVLVEGQPLYLNPNDEELSPYLALHGYFEKMETDLVHKYVKPGMRVLDIGANIGYFTVMCSVLAGKHGQVVALEPDDTNFSFLKRSVAELPTKNVHLVQAAAWSNSGQLDLYLSSQNPGDHQSFPGDDARHHYTVEAVAIDDLPEARDGFDFIKMDIQGAEGHALRGMKNILANQPPAVMLLEFWPSSLERAGTSPQKIFASLVQHGYRIHRVSNEEVTLYPVQSYQDISDYCDLDWKFVNLLCLQDV